MESLNDSIRFNKKKKYPSEPPVSPLNYSGYQIDSSPIPQYIQISIVQPDHLQAIQGPTFSMPLTNAGPLTIFELNEMRVKPHFPINSI
jgi:hypothetical protein